MSAGTALSRLTGFLRLAAMAYALGITESAPGRRLQHREHHPEHHLRARARRDPDLGRRPRRRRVAPGARSRRGVGRRPAALHVRDRGAVGDRRPRHPARAVDRATSTRRASPTRRPGGGRELATFFLRWFMPQIVFYGVGAVAIGLLNAHRRFAAPMFAPILNNLIVIATFADLRGDAGPGPPAPASSRPTAQQLVLAIGTTARRRRDDARAVAVRARDGVPVPVAAGVAATRRSCGSRGWRPWVFVYVVANQVGVPRRDRPGRAARRAGTRRTRPRSSCSSSRTRSSPCRSSPRCSRRCPAVGRRRPRRASAGTSRRGCGPPPRS